MVTQQALPRNCTENILLKSAIEYDDYVVFVATTLIVSLNTQICELLYSFMAAKTASLKPLG